MVHEIYNNASSNVLILLEKNILCIAFNFLEFFKYDIPFLVPHNLLQDKSLLHFCIKPLTFILLSNDLYI